jgi:hypothetical protein
LDEKRREMVKVTEAASVAATVVKHEQQQPSYLLLEDGTLFKGYSFGYEADTEGEIGKR